MPQSGPHLRIQREKPINPQRPKRFWDTYKPENPKEHSRILFEQLQQAVVDAQAEIGGFDDRHLLRIQVRKGLRPEDLAALKVEVVSQEDDTIILVFADEGGLKTFESRLATIMRGEKATRQALLYALEAFSVWTEEDRTAWALRKEGFPQTDTFLLDVELWPLTRPHDQTRMTRAFESWMSEQGIDKTDSIKRSTLILYRMRVNERQAQLLLRHRDVRTVDLPPRYALEPRLLQLDINVLPKIPAVPRNAPGLVVLDSGITTNHPLLRSAIGDAQSFVPNDNNVVGSHGTQVAGIALYDDVAECANTQNFIPRLRIFSGRVWDEDGSVEQNTTFMENNIYEAVYYFKTNYGCRIFNLSFGDSRKPYLGGHIRGLAVILDELARTEGVLFVVSTGNFLGTETVPQDWLRDYPNYLSTQEARLIDPAPALNVLTVGSIARTEVSFYAQRYANYLEEQPIARRGQPSPFTRRGPSVKGAIKPELIDYGGNYSIAIRAHRAPPSRQGLGELSTSDQFTSGGQLLAEDVGTSFAAPHVTHLAAKLLYEIPTASSNLIRALLVAHARHPPASIDLFEGDREKLNMICGYGQVQPNALFRSLENQVTLWAEDRIENKKHHFYEIPIPEDFYSRGKRLRELTVALAHTPAIRTTRIDYKATQISFRLVEGLRLNEVITSFNANTPKDEHENIGELVSNRSLAETTRSKGTVQACTWQFKIINSSRRKKKLFLIVTRKDSGQWGSSISDQYEYYALVIFLSDQEGQNVRIYTQLKNKLGARMKARMQM
jgi:hypothetical protein